MQFFQQCTLGLVLAAVDGSLGLPRTGGTEGDGPYEGDGLPAQGELGVIHLACRCLHCHAAALGNLGLHARPVQPLFCAIQQAWQAAGPLARREVLFVYCKRLHCWVVLEGE